MYFLRKVAVPQLRTGLLSSHPRQAHRRPALAALPLIAALCLLLALAFTPLPAAAQAPSDPSLAAAVALKHDGHYEAATSALEAIVQAGSSPELARALYELADCYELQYQWPAAADTWQRLVEYTYERHPRSVALFRSAHALQWSGRYREAAEAFVAYYYLQPASAGAGPALQGAGDCYAAAGEPALAAYYLGQALTGMPPSEERTEAVLKLSDYLLLSDQAPAALALLESEAPDVPTDQVPAYLYRWGQAERAAGQEAAGVERLETVFRSYPRSAAAHSALVTLLEAGQPVDEYWRGLVDYNAKAYQPATAAFERYLEAGPTQHQAAARYYAGLSYLALKDYDAALDQFDQLISEHPDDPEVPRALLAKGNTLARAGRPGEAEAVYASLVQSYPEHELASEALLSRGTTLEQSGRPEEALASYARLYTEYPGSPLAPDAAVAGGLLRYRAGDAAGAEESFRVAADLGGEGENAGRYRYWLARSLLDQGKAEEAQGLLESLAGGQPNDYFAFRAHVLLGEADPFAGQESNLLLDGDRAEAEVWLQRWVNAEWQPGQMAPSVTADPRFAVAQEYLELGLEDEATDIALSLSRSLARDVLAQYTLAVWLREEGLYRPSIQCAANILYTQPSPETNVPRFIWTLVYPTYYSDLVLTEADDNGLDPLLFFALMRQESLFDARIGSWAGAQGLAQVMPATGEWIAQQLGEPAYDQTDLLRPSVAVRYGVWYLKAQLLYLDGNAEAALAAYNAGPGNAELWAGRAGGDPDLFYEEVEFKETRKYLSTVLPNYYQYCRLYREQ